MAIGISGMAFNFLAMILLPLAEATTIGFSVPIFATALAALLLGEPTGKWRWSAVAAGFIGVLIIVQPGSGHIPLFGASVAVIGAILTAGVTIVLRRLGATERTTTTVFWFALSSLVPLALLMLFHARMHDPFTWLLLAGIAVAGGLGQLAITSALRLAPVALVMPMDYTSLLWATVFGAWLFGQLPTPWTWVGAPIIVASGLVIVWRERKLAFRKPLSADGAIPT
jgi:drug/metabolite transporter (DMT)-like permease